MVERHERKECNPCAFLHSKEDGCRLGDTCTFCHLCPPNALHRRKWEKHRRIKRENDAAKAKLAEFPEKLNAPSNVGDSSCDINKLTQLAGIQAPVTGDELPDIRAPWTGHELAGIQAPFAGLDCFNGDTQIPSATETVSMMSTPAGNPRPERQSLGDMLSKYGVPTVT